MNCACHGEAMLWAPDTRYKAGGFWRCAVKNAARMAAYYEKHRDAMCESRRERYARDPIYRIEKRLNDDSRKRAATLNRKREALHGSLPH